MDVLWYNALCTHHIPLQKTKKYNSDIHLAESSKHTLGGVTFQLDTQYSIKANTSAWHCSKCFIHSFISSSHQPYHHHFTNEEAEAKEGKVPCPKSQLVSGEVRIQTQSICVQNSHSKSLSILPLIIWSKIYHSFTV